MVGFKMIRERRNAAFKKRVALEAIKEKKTTNEIASAFDVHPVQVGKKKKESLEMAAIEGSLHEKIGRLTMELDWLKKSLSMSNIHKRELIESKYDTISVSRQCELLGLARSSYYWKEAPVDPINLHLMRLIDEEYTRHPFLWSRKMALWLNEQGYPANRKRVQALMRKMGIAAIYQKPNLSKASKRHKIYPYLLRGVAIVHPNQVWSTDITYMSTRFCFVSDF
jgi:putative transposase